MVQYLQFDSRKGTVAPFNFSTSNVPPVSLLRVQDIILVNSPSATSQEIYVYYNVPSADAESTSDSEFNMWAFTTVHLSAPQVDYEAANWLRNEIQEALEMVDGPPILTVTSIPPITIDYIASW